MRIGWLAAVLGMEALAAAALLTVALDLWAHSRVEQLGGVNVWGYRGPVLPQKAPNEIRIAVVGGDLAFGWGVAAAETVAPNLRQLAASVLDRPGGTPYRVTAVNLGALGLPPSSYATHVERHRNLRPDVICIYADPARAGHGQSVLPRADSAVFAATGYVPMLPLLLMDKGRSMQSATVERAGRLLETIDSALYRLLSDRVERGGSSYADAIDQAIHTGLAIASGVVVVAPPYTGATDDVESHRALVAMAASRVRNDRRVRFVDLGDVPELRDDSLRLDGVNFSAGGHAMVGARVAPSVIDLIDLTRIRIH